MGNKKLQVWLPLIFSLVLIAGMFLGYGIDFFKTSKKTSLKEALDFIQSEYVDKVNLDSLQGDAIQEMMNHLDPHSVYFPATELKEVDEDLAGNFQGIGVEFNVFNDTVNVVYVIANGPSDKAGLQIGDKIIKVNDSSLTTKNLTTEEIKKLIRGKRGSKVILQVLRNNGQQTFTVTRGTIPVLSVDASYMIDKTTGYIKLNKFTETSYEEFMYALEQLQKEGLQQLILDLRGNGGGLMDEAVDMADEFLDGDKLIVYTEGNNSKKREYRCKRDGLFEKGKLTILVDELTASASEVLAGALQDWDRATIIGRRTFGKGLVQQQYPLSDGSAIRLTVARYYTPLGRSIQRSYEKGKKVYMDELWDRYSNGQLLYADSNKINNGKQYKTRSGKIVYGGGGIMPDIFVAIDTSHSQQKILNSVSDDYFSRIVYNYYLEHKQEIEKYSSASDYAQHFNAGNIWDGFIRHPGGSMDFEIVTGKEKELMQQRLKAMLARYRWRNTGFYEVMNSDDAVIKKAEDQLAK